jgi:hypothetical protein
MKTIIVYLCFGLLLACAPTQRGPADPNAARQHSAAVYRAALDALSSLPVATASSLALQTPECLVAGSFRGSETSFGNYSFGNAPFGVKSCTIRANGRGDFTVTVTMESGLIFINGK